MKSFFRRVKKSKTKPMVTPEQAQADAQREFLEHYSTGKYGPGSELHIKPTALESTVSSRNVEALGTMSGFSKFFSGLNYLFLNVGGKVLAKNKRARAMRMIKLHSQAYPRQAGDRVFAISRLLLMNRKKMHSKSPLYDDRIETEIFTFFGQRAMEDGRFAALEPFNRNTPIDEYGKAYFRSLVRKHVLGNFAFLKQHYRGVDRKFALEFAMVGDNVKGPEKVDAKRIDFIASIFGKEIKEIDAAYNTQPQRRKIYDALIGIQAKAKEMLPSEEERISFYRKVCSHYKVGRSEVDRFAKSFYKRTKNLMARRPQLTEELRLADDLCKQIETVYGDWVKVQKVKPPKYIIPPGGVTFRPQKRR